MHIFTKKIHYVHIYKVDMNVANGSVDPNCLASFGWESCWAAWELYLVSMPWETYHNGVPLLGVPGITLDQKQRPAS